MTKMAEFRSKDKAELNQHLESLLREQFKLRLARSNEEVTGLDISKFKKIRRDIARILTLLGNEPAVNRAI